MLHTSLIVRLPGSHAGQALNFREQEFRHEPNTVAGPRGGRGFPIFVGPASSAASLVFDGPQKCMAIRKKGDEDVAMEVVARKMQVNTDITSWSVGLEGNVLRNASCKFCFNSDDCTLSPCTPEGKPCAELVVGLNLGEEWRSSNFSLVRRDDFRRRIVFETGEQLSEICNSLTESVASADASKQRVLIIKSPACDWLGKGPKALALRGNGYTVEAGRGHAVRVAQAYKGLTFSFDGVASDAMALRKHDDQDLALEVNHRKNNLGDQLSLWNSGGQRQFACKFAFTPDRTLAPFGKRHVVLGVKEGTDVLILVDSNDSKMRMVFETDSEMETTTQMIREQQLAAVAAAAALESEAVARCDSQMMRSLRDDGFVHIPGAVPPELVRRARQEINRSLGSSNVSTDMFKAKTFPKSSEITDLFNASMLPFVLKRLLGPLDGAQAYRQEAGQIALRFPGDMCHHESVECDFQHFENIRRGWHIDGTPNDLIPGLTDHWGQIGNFDALVGVLLSDVHEDLSGELCCYPGSHLALAEYFKKHGLDDVANRGFTALPTGIKTDELFKSEVKHCVGKSGDVFLANYMTAHFIAPNTATDIRYAVYFRIRGPTFQTDPQNRDGMYKPLENWHLDGEQVPRQKSMLVRAKSTMEDLEKISRLQDLYAAGNNDHTVPKSS